MKIVSLVGLSESDAKRIRAVDPSIDLTLAGGWFNGEYRDTWPDATASRYLTGEGHGTREDRDALLAGAEVIIAGFPFPLDLMARTPNVKWVHQTPAGASNLLRGDIWGTEVPVTTSRGGGETTAIAEYAISGILHFVKAFDAALGDRAAGAFNHRRYGIRSAHDKTLCVIGAGGIGREVGRLGRAFGMRVIGTRRNTEVVDGDEVFEQLETPERLHEQLAQADFVAVCCQWTPETTNLLNDKAFSAMRDQVIVTNVARGEIIDEAALLGALDTGKVRGAALDVYVGEFESLPPRELWNHPRVLITPHTSAQTDSSRRRSTDMFIKNMLFYLEGKPLNNRIDWSVGY